VALGTPTTIGTNHTGVGTASTATLTTTVAVPSGATAVIVIGSGSTNRDLTSVADDAGNTWNIAI
jgi:hypothetical protein